MATDREIVLITGSSGLIGTAVGVRLAEVYHVVGFDRPGEPHPPEQVEAVDVDLTSDESVQEGLRQVRDRHGDRLASVIHLAAYYDFKGEPSPLYDEVTVRGTGRLLRGLRNHFRCEQFVFSSTMLVHRPCEPGQKIDEDWPLDPTWDYPASKVRTEELIRNECGDIPTVLLRIAGVYDDWCHSIPLAHQIQRIYEKQLTSHFYPADPSRGQAFVHLDDLVDAFARVVARRGQLPPETALLIGEPETVSYEELQQAIGRLIHGEEWDTYRVPKVVAKVGAWVQDHLPGEAFIKPWMIDRASDHYELDVTRARGLLGWEPHQSLRGTLPAMVGALKADPLRWYEENRLDPPAGLREQATAGRTG
jgi:nucleoside-diphosphate-sugar epimerase